MDHQNWEPIVFKNPKPSNTLGNKSKKLPIKNTNKIESEEIPVEKVNPYLKKEVLEARMEKGYTKQKDLSKVASVPIKDIQAVESGKMPDKATIAKLSRALGKKFRRTLEEKNKEIEKQKKKKN